MRPASLAAARLCERCTPGWSGGKCCLPCGRLTSSCAACSCLVLCLGVWQRGRDKGHAKEGAQTRVGLPVHARHVRPEFRGVSVAPIAQQPCRCRDDMLEDRRRAGDAAAQARSAEGERAQAQMSAMHLASAGSGGPPAQAGGPPHGYGAPHHGAQVRTEPWAAPTRPSVLLRGAARMHLVLQLGGRQAIWPVLSAPAPCAQECLTSLHLRRL